MTKKSHFTKFVAMLIIFAVLCSLISVQAFAGTNYFSRSTGIMNALNGGASAKWPASSGSISGTNPQVTSVVVNLTVNSGSSPVYLYVESPNGTIAYNGTYGVGSRSVTFNAFNGENPSGTWNVWIRTTGTVSTSTATIRVNYSY
jgi:hypothetical protein